MLLGDLDRRAYLDRINDHGPVDPSLETLRRLHCAHHLAVPFENLYIHLAKPIMLEEGALFDKIVRRRRGGFCYELNGLFALLLRSLGFKVTLLSAGVAREQGGFGPEFDHMALLVELEEPWLADVGFGDSFQEPLRLNLRQAQAQSSGTYRIIEQEEYLILEREEDGSGWAHQYRFTLVPRNLHEFSEMCRYHQTSPSSSFTRQRICSLATADGRTSLSDMKLITTSAGRREERILTSEAEYAAVLASIFGITL